MKNKFILKTSGTNATLAATLLIKGKVIIYPTDTLFSFGADATNDNAIKILNNLKRRNMPLSILIKDLNEINKYAIINEKQQIKLNNIFPGAFTALLPSNNNNISKLVQCDSPLIGIRIINQKFSNDVLSILNRPIITTSINIHDKPPMINIKKIANEFNNIYIFYEDLSLNSIGSTIIDFSKNPEKIVRQGEGIYR